MAANTQPPEDFSDLMTPAANLTDLIEKPKSALQQAGDSFVEAAPTAARMAGGFAGAVGGAMVGALGGPAAPVTVPMGALGGSVLLAEAMGQAVGGVIDYIKGRSKSPAQIAKEALQNMKVDAEVQMALPIIGKVAGPLVRKALTNERAAAVAKDLTAADIDQSGAATILGSRGVQGMMHLEQNLPVASTWIQKAVAKTQESIANSAERTASLVGATKEPYRAGQIIKEGVDNFVATMDEKAAAEYAKVKIPSPASGGQLTMAEGTLAVTPKAGGVNLLSAPVDVSAMKAEARKVVDEITKARNDVPAWLSKFTDDAVTPNIVSFEEAQLMRSSLARTGRDITERVAGTSMNAAKRLTNPIDKAMEETGKDITKGNPEAFDAFRKANAIVKEKYATLEHITEVRDGAKGIDAWNAATQQMKADPTKLLALKKALTPDEWGEFVGARIRDMGMETRAGGADVERQFNPERFLASWREMGEGAKDAAFGKGGELRDSLDRLARISSAFKSTKEQPFGFFGRMLIYSTIAGPAIHATYTHSVGGAVTTGGMLGAALGTAKLFTYAPFVKRLTEAGMVHPANFQGVSAQIARLVTITQVEPRLKNDVQGYLDNIAENDATGAVRGILTGKAVTAAQEAQKPLLARFQDSRAIYEAQDADFRNLSKMDQSRLEGGLSNERRIGASMLAAGKQIDQLQSLEESISKAPPDAGTSANLVKIRDAKNRIARGALNLRDAVYAKS